MCALTALPTLAETDEIGHRRAWQLALYEDFYAFLNNGMAANGRIYCSGRNQAERVGTEAEFSIVSHRFVQGTLYMLSMQHSGTSS